MNQNKDSQNTYYNHVVSEALNRWKNEEPVRRGCPNAGGQCFCTGVCNEIISWKPRAQSFPQVFPTPNEEEVSHFEDIEETQTCSDVGHQPPMHLHIPQGKRYIHICPSCKARTVLQPPQIRF